MTSGHWNTVKALLATTLVSDQLYLRPALWNPVWLSDHSRKRPRPLLWITVPTGFFFCFYVLVSDHSVNTLIKALGSCSNLELYISQMLMVPWLLPSRTSSVIGNKKLFNIITTKLLVTINIRQALRLKLLQATTLYCFIMWSLTRANSDVSDQL